MIRLSDEQWEHIRKHFPEEHIPDGCPGRKPIPTRRVLEGVLWILNTGAQWHMLPQSYPNYKTVHRRFQACCRSEVLRQILTDVANELRDKGVLDEEESFIDATFAMAKGGGAEIGPTKRGNEIGSINLSIINIGTSNKFMLNAYLEILHAQFLEAVQLATRTQLQTAASPRDGARGLSQPVGVGQ